VSVQTAPLPSQRHTLDDAVRPSRWRYVLGGAVIGGAAGGPLAYRDVQRSDAILGELGVVIATGAGAAVGAGAGWAHSLFT